MHLHMDETKFPCVGMSAELQGTHAKRLLQYQNVCAKCQGTEINPSRVRTDNSYQMQYIVYSHCVWYNLKWISIYKRTMEKCDYVKCLKDFLVYSKTVDCSFRKQLNPLCGFGDWLLLRRRWLEDWLPLCDSFFCFLWRNWVYIR